MDYLHNVDKVDNIEHMEKPFDAKVCRMSKNQLLVLRAMLPKASSIMTTREIARKTGVVEKSLGGVLSAMSRKREGGMCLLELLGKDDSKGMRFRVNSKAITVVLADKQVRSLLASFK